MKFMRFAGLAAIALLSTSWASQPALSQERNIPIFEVDPSWPSLPNNWILGQVASVTTDGRDHVWILHRPRTVSDEERARAAPAVLEFDAAGMFIQAWGGPATGYEWPANEHGIHVDYRNHVWVGGNSEQPESDDMLLKFTTSGEPLLQIGRRGQSGGNSDTDNVN